MKESLDNIKQDAAWQGQLVPFGYINCAWTHQDNTISFDNAGTNTPVDIYALLALHHFMPMCWLENLWQNKIGVNVSILTDVQVRA